MTDVITFLDTEPDRDPVCRGEPIFYTFICLASCLCGKHTKILEARPHVIPVEETIKKVKTIYKKEVKKQSKVVPLTSFCRVCRRRSFSRYELCGVCRVKYCRSCLGPKEPRVSLCADCFPQKLNHVPELGAQVPCRKCEKPCYSLSKLCRTCKKTTCVGCQADRVLPSIYCKSCSKVFNFQTCVIGEDGFPRYHLLDKRLFSNGIESPKV